MTPVAWIILIAQVGVIVWRHFIPGMDGRLVGILFDLCVLVSGAMLGSALTFRHCALALSQRCKEEAANAE